MLALLLVPWCFGGAALTCLEGPCRLGENDLACRFAKIGNAGGGVLGNLTLAATPSFFCDLEPTADFTGQIVAAYRGRCEFQQKVRNAVKGGALGLMILMDGPLESAPLPSTNDASLRGERLVVVSVSRQAFESAHGHNLSGLQASIANRHTWCGGLLAASAARVRPDAQRRFELFPTAPDVALATGSVLAASEPAMAEQLLQRAKHLLSSSNASCLGADLALVAFFLSQNRINEAVAQASEIDSRAVLTLRQAGLLGSVYFNRANLCLQDQDWEEAVDWYSFALRHRPTKAAFFNKAQALQAVGNTTALIENAEQAVQEIPDDSTAWRLMAEALKIEPNSLSWSDVSPYIYEAWTRPINSEQLSQLSAHFLLQFEPHSASFAKLSGQVLKAGAGLYSMELEARVSNIRKRLLSETQGSKLYTVFDLDWMAALASYCFFAGFALVETAEEERWVQALLSDLMRSLKSRYAAHLSEEDCFRILLLASYRPLRKFASLCRILKRAIIGVLLPTHLAAVVTEQLLEPELEAQIKRAIPTITPMSGKVSTLARQMYEADPYPRYRELDEVHRPVTTYQSFLEVSIKAADVGPIRHIRNILIAGCGTGQHLIKTACRAQGSEILAIDLSMSSLAHAKRRYQSAKDAKPSMANASLVQADITALSFKERFDVIESVGVLHHLENPLHGWNRLVTALRPGGFMLIGLYTKFRGTVIAAAHKYIKREGYQGSKAEDIRNARVALVLSADAPLREQDAGGDFQTLQGTRDLLFHVQERHYSPLELKEALQELGLVFLGFLGKSQQVAALYHAAYPDDQAAVSLENWHAFEAAHPGCHGHMYQFLVRKKR
jgi:SAM-dependent methyltransferase